MFAFALSMETNADMSVSPSVDTSMDMIGGSHMSMSHVKQTWLAGLISLIGPREQTTRLRVRGRITLYKFAGPARRPTPAWHVSRELEAQ